jgi:hypothetical protein
MNANRFVLSIMLGNDAMRTWGDIARAMRSIADKIDEPHDDPPVDGDGDAIRDVNGNRVGGWHTDMGE